MTASPRLGPTTRLLVLVCLGAASAALYVVFLGRIRGLALEAPTLIGDLLPPWPVIPSWYDPRSFDPDVRPHVLVAPWFVAFLTMLFGLYGVALRVAAPLGSPRALTVVVVAAAVFQIIGIFAPYMLSTDAYSYVMYGRMFERYGLNPFAATQAQIPDDLFARRVPIRDIPTSYGPAFTLLSGIVTRLVGDREALMSTVFRLLSGGGAVATTLAVAWAMRSVAPARVAVAALFLGWNPLLVLESGVGGHNDAIMNCLIAIAVGLMARRHQLLAIVALTCGALIKAPAGLLIPLFALYAVRARPGWSERVAFLLKTGAVCLVLVVLTAAPFRLTVVAPLQIYAGDSHRYVNSLLHLATVEMKVWLGESRDDASVAFGFEGRWMTVRTDTPLFAGEVDSSDAIELVPAGQSVLSVTPQERRWVRVFNPGTGNTGNVRLRALDRLAARPAEYADDPRVRALELGPRGSPIHQSANLIVRVAGWVAFAVVYALVAIRPAHSIEALAHRSTIVFLASYHLIAAWFHPWYVTWAVVTASICLGSVPAWWTAAMAWSAPLTYASGGYSYATPWLVYVWRALPIFVPPPIIVGLVSAARWWRRPSPLPRRAGGGFTTSPHPNAPA